MKVLLGHTHWEYKLTSNSAGNILMKLILVTWVEIRPWLSQSKVNLVWHCLEHMQGGAYFTSSRFSLVILFMCSVCGGKENFFSSNLPQQVCLGKVFPCNMIFLCNMIYRKIQASLKGKKNLAPSLSIRLICILKCQANIHSINSC